MWNWCENRNLWIYASYIASRNKVLADFKSRILVPETEYELLNTCFIKIAENFGTLDIHLFATGTDTKCSKYVSCFKDPYAYKIGVFSFKWNKSYLYPFPLFSIFVRFLKKKKQEKSCGIIVVPLNKHMVSTIF